MNFKLIFVLFLGVVGFSIGGKIENIKALIDSSAASVESIITYDEEVFNNLLVQRIKELNDLINNFVQQLERIKAVTNNTEVHQKVRSHFIAAVNEDYGSLKQDFTTNYAENQIQLEDKLNTGLKNLKVSLKDVLEKYPWTQSYLDDTVAKLQNKVNSIFANKSKINELTEDLDHVYKEGIHRLQA